MIVLGTVLALMMACLACPATAQIFDPTAYTCQQFTQDTQDTSPNVGFALLWAMGWIDGAKGQPSVVDEMSINELSNALIGQCGTNPAQLFHEALSLYALRFVE